MSYPTTRRMGGITKSNIYFFYALFFFLFLLLASSTVIAHFKSHQAVNWPVTLADIKSVDMRNQRDKFTTTHKVIVNYQWQVNGVAYYGERVAFGNAFTPARQKAEDLFERLKNSERVEIRYDAANPDQATILTGHNFILTQRYYVLAIQIAIFMMIYAFLVTIHVQIRRE